ncbi:MAG: BrnA antitoxin family protein [Pseudomonadota bacterium]
MSKRKIDNEMIEFEEALLRSLDQSMRGEGRVTTAQQIAARRGRPVGSVKAKPKVPTTIRFDQDILDTLKASGRGWQTRVNDAVRDWLARQSKTN